MDNLINIEADIEWLAQIIKERVKDRAFDFDAVKPINFEQKCVYSNFINSNCKNNEERLLVILVLVPHIYPVFLHRKFTSTYLHTSTRGAHSTKCPEHYSAIVKSSTSESYLPTGQTFLYLVGGDNIRKRVKNIRCIYEGVFFTITNNIISPIKNSTYDPLLGNIITLNQNYALAFLTNNEKLINNEKRS